MRAHTQVRRNNELRPIWDVTLSNFKRKHRGEQAVLLEETSVDGSTGTTAMPHAVGESELGLSPIDWDHALAVESFLNHPKMVKDKIETNTFNMTAAQAYQVLFDLKEANHEEVGETQVLRHPASADLSSRKRKVETRNLEDLPQFVADARGILHRELQTRVFGTSFEDRPSDIRLVQLHMSKQMPVEDVLPPILLSRARAIYLQMLREAATINGTAVRTVPPKTAAKTNFFRSGAVASSISSMATSAATAANTTSDPVQLEVQRWAALPQEKIQSCDMGDGLINEFDLIYSVRKDFPLHYTLFRMVAVHIAHEGNSESTFSEAGGVAQASIDADFMAVLVRINGNKAIYKPGWEDILSEYKLRFGKPTAEEINAERNDVDAPREDAIGDGCESEIGEE